MEDRRRPVEDLRPGRMPWRRIPGTTALATTNLIAAGLILDVGIFTSVSALAYLHRVVDAAVWASLFAISAGMLIAAVIWRRWWALNIGAALSLGLWTATGISVVAAWVTGSTVVSPIALALVWWMLAGQASMLIVPLLDRTRGEA
jgi:hypothetical protein